MCGGVFIVCVAAIALHLFHDITFFSSHYTHNPQHATTPPTNHLGPTFRAENSNTRRHLAEFWMIEPEMAFCDIHDDMQCAEDYVKYCCNHVLTHCRADLEFVAQRIDKTCIARLENVAGSEFKRVPYTEAITLLEEAIAKNKVKFDNPVCCCLGGEGEGGGKERGVCIVCIVYIMCIVCV